ncbi:prepilin peptidase [Gordonibacter sp.]|uniref:prepilin peptidase n=1 Tax=Gordonibacter sp. TaxID=1968902 RepID=UPI002FC64E99
MVLFVDIFTPAQAAVLLGIAAVLGAVMGSFINCLAWRVVNGESVLRGRSHCPACGHTLGVLDLVPILSWVMIRGKCRYCKQEIGARYVLVEIAMAAFFALLLWKYGLGIQTVAYWALACILCGAALVDVDTYTIPNGFIVAGIALWAASVWLISAPATGFGVGSLFVPLLGSGFFPVLVDGLVGGLVVGGGILLFSLIFDKVTGRTSLGGGDVKLLFVVGLSLGLLGSLFNLILACVLGLVLAFVWQLFASRSLDDDGESFKTRAIPFGPAIAVATLLTLLVGSQFLTWYMGLLGY